MGRGMFTYFWYESFLSELSGKVDVFSFANWTGGNGLLLRHDVDLDIRPALRMAKIEHNLGISSTYFILISSDFYNPLSLPNRNRLKELVALGHEIGLHFDPTVYGETGPAQLQQKAEREASILAEASGSPVKTISLHCPSIHGMFPLFSGFTNAYDPKFFRDDRYISDSCMNFRGKNPYEWAQLARNRTVQFLIHPMHYSDNHETYTTIFANKILEMSSDVERYFRIIEPFDKDLGRGSLFDVMQKNDLGKGFS